MMEMAISKDELKCLIRETVQESIEIQFMKIRASLIPYISNKEQHEIDELYHKPSKDMAYSTKLEV